MKEKKTNLITLIAEIAIISALGFVLDELGSGMFKALFPKGGSITIAMAAVLVLGFRRGFVPAMISGFIIGTIDALTGAMIVGTTPIAAISQLCLDYLLAYVAASLGTLFAPLFKKATTKKMKVVWLVVGAAVGGLSKLLIHYLSGVIFYANPSDFAWNLNTMNPYLYSLIYNGAYTVPSMLLSLGVVVAIYFSAPQVFLEKKIEKEENK